ncbi:malonic semialdehyde reductase [Arthrobacter sulfonylureivorans]|uniref:Malonic semialdehyde reductase n=1 Tax=Arthrobacter sulfonylureivorans TaxID=2486855 RepID=A0ABY3W5H7_9MICC|nr:malonic semialdehyde reductase [Arthrobacter sulfonylureivorans]UNK45522.1 malonic semialdehyde reductase [Arthrobacter sulfonylureivorans]
MSVETADVNLQNQLSVGREAADHLFLEARTANTFSTEPVTDEQLAAIYELAKMGPTMMNNQPLRITWVRSAEAREKLAARMAEGNRAKTHSAPMVAVLSYDTDWHEHFETFFPHAPERKEMFDGNAEMRAEVAKNNAWLQAGFFIMAVRAVGLHAGPMGAFDAAGIDEDFNAGTANRTFMVVNVGTPGENPWFPRLPRLDAEIAVQTV